MSPPPVHGALTLGGAYELRRRGALTLGEPRELLADRSTPGAYGPDGVVARDTVRAVFESAFTGPVPDGPGAEGVVRVCDEEVVWGGSVMDHFGHFLTESVSRLWPLLPGAALEGRPVVLVRQKRSPFVLEWLEAFGARIVELPERGAVRFTRMFVPEPALRHSAWIAEELRDVHLHARRGLDLPECPSRDVLWLSRSKLGRDRAPYDESLLEWLLGEHVAAIHPETMTLAEQVAAVERSRAVAGVAGSAFHTLLMAEQPPDCLYLCPPWDKEAYPAQHRVLEGDATFVHALDVAASGRRARDGVAFPGAYRVLIPEALRALSATVLPGLRDDPRLASLATLDRDRPGARRWTPADEVDAAVTSVLRNPLAIAPRMRLGKIFESEGLLRCALEQFAMVADLVEGYAGAAASAARLRQRIADRR